MQSWVWWLLPLLVARALMPMGFMAQVHEGKFQIVFCVAGSSESHAADQDPPGNQHGSSQADFSCPFAHAAAAPLLDLSGSEAIAFIRTAEVLPPAESRYYAIGPPRFIAITGPPQA